MIWISCGQFHDLLLSSGGDTYSFGNNTSGQIGTRTRSDKLSPTKLIHEEFSWYGISLGRKYFNNYHLIIFIMFGVRVDMEMLWYQSKQSVNHSMK